MSSLEMVDGRPLVRFLLIIIALAEKLHVPCNQFSRFLLVRVPIQQCFTSGPINFSLITCEQSFHPRVVFAISHLWNEGRRTER